ELAGEAELVEERGLVAGDARGEDVLLPGADGSLDAGELLDDLQETGDAVELRLRRGVLPDREEAMEIRRADRLDGAAEAAERETVDAREEPAVAPLRRRRAGGEAAREDDPMPPAPAEAAGDAAGRDRHPRGAPLLGLGPDDPDPPADDGLDPLPALGRERSDGRDARIDRHVPPDGARLDEP